MVGSMLILRPVEDGMSYLQAISVLLLAIAVALIVVVIFASIFILVVVVVACIVVVIVVPISQKHLQRVRTSPRRPNRRSKPIIFPDGLRMRCWLVTYTPIQITAIRPGVDDNRTAILGVS